MRAGRQAVQSARFTLMAANARRRAEEFHRRIGRWDADISDEDEIRAIEKFAADAVAQAVKERDEWISKHRGCVESLTGAVSGLNRQVDEHAEEIARLNRDIMRHESDRAIREKEITRLEAIMEERADATHIASAQAIEMKADQIDALRADLRWADEEIARLRDALKEVEWNGPSDD